MPDVSYTIKQLELNDVSAYKDMRLEALRLEPGMFCSSYEKEVAFGDEIWLNRLSNKDAAHFGLYADEELIGITGIIKDSAQEGNADLIQSYIREGHRGKKLSRMFYEARLDWARKNDVKRVIVGHRLSNSISKAANQHYGFVYTKQEARDWPDGTSEEILYYELELR